MGFIKDSKREMLSKQASRRREEGATVFVATLNMPRTRADISGEVEDWSEMIEGVTQRGMGTVLGIRLSRQARQATTCLRLQ